MRLPACLATLLTFLVLPAAADDLRSVSGQVVLLERLAIPDSTVLLVDISTAQDAPAHSQRVPTEGSQSPFAYEIAVPTDQDLVLRLGLRAADEMLWLSEPKILPAGTDPLDLGTIRALRVPQMGFTALHACGNTLVEIGFLPDVTRVRLNEQVLSLQPQPAASGALYADPANPATSLHMKGDTARLTVDGAELSECTYLRPERDFTEGVWNISAIEENPTLFPSRTELVFFPDGRITATVGCNRFIGSYRRHGGILSFGAGASTLMACPDGLAEQERRFATVLPRIDGYTLEAGRLNLTAQGRTLLQARK